MRSLLRHPNYYKKILHFFKLSVKMSGKSVNFGDEKIKKVFFTKAEKYLR